MGTYWIFCPKDNLTKKSTIDCVTTFQWHSLNLLPMFFLLPFRICHQLPSNRPASSSAAPALQQAPLRGRCVQEGQKGRRRRRRGPPFPLGAAPMAGEGEEGASDDAGRAQARQGNVQAAAQGEPGGRQQRRGQVGQSQHSRIQVRNMVLIC